MARHIIHKQQVTLSLPTQEAALAFQSRVSDLLRNEIASSAEAVFDELFPTSEIIRIDSLLLDLGKVDPYNFEQEFKTHFIEELRKSLSAKKDKLIDENNEEILSPEQSVIKTFIYFLENGYLPWYSTIDNIASWTDEILKVLFVEKGPFFFAWLRDNYADDPVILQRLILQFSNAFLDELLLIIAPAAGESWGAIYHDLELVINNFTAKGPSVRDEIWQQIFHSVLNKPALEDDTIMPGSTDNGHVFQALPANSAHTNPVFRALSLLVKRFDISNQNITESAENKLKKELKTNSVKEALKRVHLHLVSREDLIQDKEDTAISNPRETETNHFHDTKKEVALNNQDIVDKKQPKNADSLSISSERENKLETNKTDKNSKSDINKADKNNKADEIEANEIEGKTQTSTSEDENSDKILDPQTIDITKEEENQFPADINNETQALLKPENKAEKEGPVKNRIIDKPAKLSPQTKKHKGISEKESLFIKNGGIVLLHYFLAPYFDDLGLLTDKKFKDDGAHQRAVLLLHYLATGKAEAAEFDLTLHKILCGYPLEQTLPVSIKLTRKEKTESKRLLEAIIDHWSPLKNTSVKGLRDTFFERDGKLMKKENGWLLTVEQKTIDVLLGKLPWGYSTIRHPWMQEVLNVDWY